MIVISDLTEVQFNKLDAKILKGLKNDYNTKADRWCKPIIEAGKYSMAIEKNILKYLPKNLKTKIKHRPEQVDIQEYKDILNRDGTNT